MFEHALFIIFSYAIIGGGLKYIDQFYDIHVFDKKIVWILSVICGLLMGTLIAFDGPSAIILLGIIISVAITRKIDNVAFYTGALLCIIIPMLLYSIPIIPNYELQINWLLITPIILSGIFDEFLDGIGDRKKIKALTVRPTMKLMILLLWIFDVFSWVYVIAFIAFDVAYMYVMWYSHEVVKAMTPLERRGKGVIVE